MKRKLFNHPHFEWVMKYAKEKDNVTRLFKAYATRMKKSSKEPKFKFGIQVLHNHNQVKHLDIFNKDNLLEEAEGKDIGSLEKHSTFIVLEENEPIPQGYKQIPYHFVFDSKFDGRRKARLVAGGHRTPVISKEESYSGVVSMETIRVAFVLAALNDLEICATDISTAFLYDKTREKVLICAGPEFGKNTGKVHLIDKGLYGL